MDDFFGFFKTCDIIPLDIQLLLHNLVFNKLDHSWIKILIALIFVKGGVILQTIVFTLIFCASIQQMLLN